MRRFFVLLALGVDLVVIFSLVLLVGSRFSTSLANMRRRIEIALNGRELWLAFVVALGATLGSLYLSEIVHLPPCKYCWIQRIFMYPLTFILGIAAWKKDREVRRYVFPLAGIGATMASYHYLIENVPSLAGEGGCDPVVPCTAPVIWELGFVSVPFMALASFSLIIVLMAVARSNDRADAEEADD